MLRGKPNSLKSSEFLVAIATVVLTIHLFQFKRTCVSAQNDSKCPPSSCGKIHEIKYPFRLKGDPNGCGDPRYELACEHYSNMTPTLTLSLFSMKYHVKSINYNNYTIRIVDPAVQLQHQAPQFTCASIPRYSLYRSSFDHGDTPYKIYQQQTFLYASQSTPPSCSDSLTDEVDITRMIIFWSCSNPVMDARYVNITLCSQSESPNSEELVYASINIPSVSNEGGRIDGVVLWYDPFPQRLPYLKVGCHAKRITLTSMNIALDYTNISYSTIGDALAFGFELSWLHGVCYHDCGCTECYLDYTNCSDSPVPCRAGENHRYCSPPEPQGFRAILLGIIRRFIYGNFHYGDNLFSSFSLGAVIGELIGELAPYIGVRFIFGILLWATLLIFRWRRRHLSVYENIETFLTHNNNFTPIRYSYREIKKMTRCFKDKLGEGGYGCVYKGKLRSGSFVAIKMLTKSKANGQEFINEVATIGRIHHVNVVKLIGFCVEGSKRALVYEFMANGSLDKHIFSKEVKSTDDLSCDRMYSISLGVARGIAYLHQGCDMQILHFDIKPHNILLDENFIPKVSDFGLARLYAIDDSVVTVTARGTLGYMAPELYYKNIGGVSYKADVYSFGMLLMEMVSRRKNLDVATEHLSGNNLSQIYFPTWIHDQFSVGKDLEIEHTITKEEKNIATKMIMVALWCIQMNPRERPSMKRVVEMLEAELQSIEMPLRPTLYPQATPDVNDSSCKSSNKEESSSYSYNQEHSGDAHSEDAAEISMATMGTSISN